MSEEERGSEGIEARTEEDESMSGASVQAEILVKNAVKKKNNREQLESDSTSSNTIVCYEYQPGLSIIDRSSQSTGIGNNSQWD